MMTILFGVISDMVMLPSLMPCSGCSNFYIFFFEFEWNLEFKTVQLCYFLYLDWDRYYTTLSECFVL
jgi:hypothetical protein